MWRWIIRLYVSFVVFVFLLYCSGVLLIQVSRLLLWADSPLFLQWIHAHVLFTMFLIGVLAGQAVLGSNITGRGWFRSKSGLSYEGFKLEIIKPWTWLLISPVFMLGVVSWILERSESGVWSNITLVNFYHDVLKPNCSLSWWRNYQLYPFCGIQLLCVGIWMASIGYSLAPLVRRHGSRLLRSLRNVNDATIPTEESSTSLMKEKTKSR
jgi:hypothetical protein